MDKLLEETHELNGKVVEVKKAEARSDTRNRFAPYGGGYGMGGGMGGGGYGYGGMGFAGPGVICDLQV